MALNPDVSTRICLCLVPRVGMSALPVSMLCRQARQELGAGGNGGGGMAGMGFNASSPSGLQLAGQLSPLQESTFTPHRTQPKNNLRQLLGNAGICTDFQESLPIFPTREAGPLPLHALDAENECNEQLPALAGMGGAAFGSGTARKAGFLGRAGGESHACF